MPPTLFGLSPDFGADTPSFHLVVSLREHAKAAACPIIHLDPYHEPARYALQADYPAPALVSHARMVL